MEKPAVLVVANRLPFPLDDGWKRRTFHLLRGLAGPARVTLASLHDGDEEPVRALVDSLEGRVEVRTARPARSFPPSALVLGVVTPLPYHVWRQRSPALRAAVREAVRRRPPAAALATMSHLFPYLEALVPGRPLLLDTHNIDSLVLSRYAERMRGPRRWYARMTARKLRRHEEHVFRRADRVIVCSEVEVPHVKAGAGGRAPVVIPNGVDASGPFNPAAASPVPGRLVFFGKLDYFPNTDAVEFFVGSVLPRIRAQLPNVEAHIIGPDAPPAIRALAGPGSPVRVVGPVPDIPAAVGTADVVVAPLRVGGGTRLKILEALALGRPVVSTSVGAEGLALKPGRDLVIADDPEAFARETVHLLRNPDAGRRLGEAGRATVCRLYNWSIIEDQVAALISEFLPRPA